MAVLGPQPVDSRAELLKTGLGVVTNPFRQAAWQIGNKHYRQTATHEKGAQSPAPPYHCVPEDQAEAAC